MNGRFLYALLASTALGAFTVATASPAGATSTRNEPHTVYVSSHAWSSQGGWWCAHAPFRSIQGAVEAVAPGGTVVVCPGTYHGSVTVDKRITLAGRHGATIDASGMPYGVGVTADWVTIKGLTVKNAGPLSDTSPADGIITAGFGPNGPVAANHITIVHNTVTGNLGSGIDLNSTSYSTAVGNRAIGNGVGVNVADDLGPAATHNVISDNVTDENFGGCGIALADHTGAGVSHNLVVRNVSNDNGLSTPTAPDASAGSGVILASPVPGGVVTDNTIAFNSFDGNGHGGVVVHSHVPGSDFHGNTIAFNRIGTNNLRTDTSDTETTGVYLGSAGPLTITVTGNVIGPDYYGIFTAGDVTVHGHNFYRHVTQRVGHVDTY